MTENEAHAQAFENGRKVGDAEGYARGKAEAFAESGDLISRKGLLEKTVEVPGYISKMVSSYDIATAPTIDAQPVKHGRWIFKHNPITDPKKYFIRIVCSECNLHTGQKSNYCPNCGARMDGE